MNVTSYTFQSPSTSRVQIGKPVPGSEKEEESQKSDISLKAQNETLQKAEKFAATHMSEANSVPTQKTKLDIYA